MLYLRRFYPFALRCRQCRTWSSDPLLSQLSNCTNEDELLDLVGKNKTKLSEKHVGSAINLLWQFQMKKSDLLRNIDYIRNHSQFLTLRILAENKIESMDNEALIDILYNLLRFNVEAHDSLVGELVMEGWRRLDRLSLPSLSKFALCLYEQQIYNSPLIGHIADIVNKDLASIQDTRVLSVLMITISGVISQSFRDRLIQKAEFVLETMELIPLNHARRFVQFLRNIKLSHHPLLDKCNKVFLQNASLLDIEQLAIILGLYQSLQFNNTEFRLVAKQKLMEIMDDCSNPVSFTKLFVLLAPMAGPEVRERLIETALLMADEFDHQQALAVVECMQEINCRNSQLIQKISSLLHKYLDTYRPVELAKVTQSLVLLRAPNHNLFSKLQTLLIGCLQTSVTPEDISMLTRILSMLPSSYTTKVVATRVDAILPQCNLSDLNSIATAIIKWVRRDQSNQQDPSGLYGKLLQKANLHAFQRLQKANDLDLLLEELKYITGEWFEEMLLEETMAAFQRLMNQITWVNVLEFSSFFIKTAYFCTPLLDRIAAVTLQNINKIYYSGTYSVLLPFAVLNYDPPQSEEFFEACIGHFSSHLDSFEPHLLVLLGFAMATAEYFPENLIKSIFNVEFLAKLDTQLGILSDALNRRVRLRLMELNRAVCLECPEFQIPWFHERYCQQLQQKSNGNLRALQQQIHRLLGEILGGRNFARASVLTPYYYGIDFECILDKNKKPLPYMDQNVILADLERVHWGQDGQLMGKKGLPPGAQRIAVEFLDSKAFCKNSYHLKGEVAMKKRHLEILGYQVVQIPHFEWNSMELSSKEAWIEYLKKKIFENV
ncbi:FAST kinase domain-containing protein 1, mitochondrial isoform X2 [Hemicordylus capensis]|uniref:FAST kinase domain-containing protein 1, mitochondrial isoform X2 n=1 Tax=Hemicordylus capensis TaxID=884348 RepID=UPI002303E52C|nr:FAST kinase domain-containing protein 1, mitochondrial isoform X2 [Hemicordylus capensis]XP_053120992.1 FAST kinase domain-containing protein 1, mitochondrial isoform X2 [Hemicordylus capensis]XP_053120997.1 FAST kinase domain-containing protein 1, mitochondrial isoform X2 [Hemicordylus capensis]